MTEATPEARQNLTEPKADSADLPSRINALELRVHELEAAHTSAPAVNVQDLHDKLTTLINAHFRGLFTSDHPGAPVKPE